MPTLNRSLTLSIIAGHLSFVSAAGAPVVSGNNSRSANETTIVSFAPSNTELIYSLGAADRLVGVCSYCDYPNQVNSVDRVGSFVSANLERMARIKPSTVLLVSGQEQLAGLLAHNGYHAVTLKNSTLEDIASNLRLIGQVTGHRASGDAIAAQFDRSLKELDQVVSKASAKPTVFCCVWPDPLLTIGKTSYLTDAITACGGNSISANLAQGYPHYSMERLILSNPDVIILPYESRQKTFLKKHPWSTLKAVKEKRVYFLPDARHDALARPTLRITSGLHWLATRLHPELTAALDDWYAHNQNLAMQAGQGGRRPTPASAALEKPVSGGPR
ncbi:MAG TPA: helical backbone metal receptor [Chroococcales cyanobacterium]